MAASVGNSRIASQWAEPEGSARGIGASSSGAWGYVYGYYYWWYYAIPTSPRHAPRKQA